ncbi:FAS1 domain-containing protein [Trametes punicea]|nr:FAS1 domain-containing protein [Trametes punicea]
MLLLHAVLAVVYGGLLASALPGPGGARGYQEPVLGYESSPALCAQERENVIREAGGTWQWVPDAPQMVMGTNRMHGEKFEYPHPPPIPNVPHPPHDIPAGPPHLPPYPPISDPPEEGPVPPPHHPPPGAPDSSKQTIYEYLEHNPKFSRIFKLVNYTDEITNLLNDSSAQVTFFAVPNWAFPHRRHRHHGKESSFSVNDPEDVLDVLAAAEGMIHLQDEKDKDRRDIFKGILKAVLKYETLPAAYSSAELAKNVTYATSLTQSDGSLDGEPLRVRVSVNHRPFSPGLQINIFSRVIWSDIETKNGVIHVVNRPVFPPPSIFQTAFLVPEAFSTLTSALARVGLTDAVEWRDVRDSDGKHTVDGSPAVTVFAPTNRAFARLPRRLYRYLFSPLGEKALKKLLQFHVVPELVLHADYVHNASESDVVRRTSDDTTISALYESLVQSDEMSVPDGTTRTCRYWDGIRFGEGSTASPYTPQTRGYDHAYPIPPQSAYHGPWHMPPPPPPPHYPGYEDHGYGHLHPPPPHYPFYPSQGPHYPGYAPYPPHSPPPPPPPPPYSPPFEHGPHIPPHFPHPPPHLPEHNGPFPPHHVPFDHGPFFPPYAPPFEHGPQLPPFSPHPPPPPYPGPFGHGPHSPPHYPAERPHHGFPHPKIVYIRNTTVPTLLANHSVEVVAVQFEDPIHVPGTHKSYHTGTFAHGSLVRVSDVPARNGALHVVDRLLNPRRKLHYRPYHFTATEEGQDFKAFFDQEDPEDEWEGWEEWLPRWADEE